VESLFHRPPANQEPEAPSFTGEVVTGIVAGARKEKYQVLFALCGGTGLPFGEALGINVQDISPDCSTIKIVQKAWRSQIHDFLKTDSGSREIDLCTALASMLKEYLDKHNEALKSGLLLQSRSGKPPHQSNTLRRTLRPILENLNEPKCGCHAFRRFRIHTCGRMVSLKTSSIIGWVMRGKARPTPTAN
jgi:integrase